MWIANMNFLPVTRDMSRFQRKMQRVLFDISGSEACGGKGSCPKMPF